MASGGVFSDVSGDEDEVGSRVEVYEVEGDDDDDGYDKVNIVTHKYWHCHMNTGIMSARLILCDSLAEPHNLSMKRC